MSEEDLGRVGRITARANAIFGDVAKAAEWLRCATRVFEGRAPLDLLDSDEGTRRVEGELDAYEEFIARQGRDLVPDEDTALKIGLAILEGYWGKEFVAKFEPYQAILQSGDWAIMGDSPAEKEGRREQERVGPDYLVVVRGGGAPCVTISPRDGRAERPYLMR